MKTKPYINYLFHIKYILNLMRILKLINWNIECSIYYNLERHLKNAVNKLIQFKFILFRYFL